MKALKSLMLLLALTGATYAGEILQPGPPPPSAPAAITKPTMADKAADILVAIFQNLLSLR
ncbi:MAG TPA: hypothetical protein VN643_23965 [Pyrinomonadaceae bacterium]|nr:hypothetical protein [Pyrinomonadaceae bacterium]